MPSLVIGANGFLGSQVTRLLVERGEHVRVMVRPTSNTRSIDDLDCERFVGEVTDPDALARAMDGVRDVHYCVVDARPWLRDPTPMRRTNVEALSTVLPVATAAGLRRFVFTSSIVTLTTPARPQSPRAAARWERRHGGYVVSRVDAERRVLDHARDHGLPAVSMCVANTYGSGDLSPTPHGAFVMLAAFGSLPFAPAGARADVVGIRDAAEALVLAAEHGRTGQRLAVSEGVMSTREILRIAADEAGTAAPRLSVPLGMLKAAGLLNQQRSRWGANPQLTGTTAGLMNLPPAPGADLTRAELGWAPRPTSVSVREAARFFLDQRAQRRAARTSGSSTDTTPTRRQGPHREH